KFCRTFNFELQAAATDDAIVLSLGPHHSFPLEEVARYVSSHTVRDTLEHAILDAPMFQARWRWNLNRSLMVLRFRNGRRNPPPIQRMESDDLLAAVFPQAAACQDNIVGPIEIPDHVLVRQTVDDTLHEALDVDGVRALLERVEAETTPMPETADDLHDLLSATLVLRPRREWSRMWHGLVERGRGQVLSNNQGVELWTTTEAVSDARDALAGEHAAVARVLRGHLEMSGVTTAEALSV